MDQQVAEEGTKGLSEAGMLERTEPVRPGTWPDGYAPWEGREDTPFTKAIGGVLVRGGPSITKKLSGCSPLQADADDGRKVVPAWAHSHPWERWNSDVIEGRGGSRSRDSRRPGLQ